MNITELRKAERKNYLKEQRRLAKLDRTKNNVYPNVNVGLDSELQLIEKCKEY